MPLTHIASEHAARFAEFRLRNRHYDEKFVTPGAISDYEAQGWVIYKSNRTGVRMRKARSPAQILEDRFWCCLYRLGYSELNESRNFRIPVSPDIAKQIDVFGKDAETVVIAECKTAEEYKKKSIQKDLGEFDSNKKSIADAVRAHYGRDFKPKMIWLFVLDNIALTSADLVRARELNISIVTDREITYFEEISKALGPTARQQFKAEFLPGAEIPALGNKKIPAVKTRIGGKIVYNFSSKYSDIMPIAFVNHRDLRDPSSAPTYQRLVNPNRLKKIGQFLAGGGYFPNSILLNFRSKPRFDISQKSDNSDLQFGYLYLPDKYKSVKVIDGQHRLYGCAMLGEGERPPNLFFVAFEGINGSEEANLFATINKEQQKVQKRLLDELDGELKWDSENLSERIQAVSSRAIDLLNARFGSPFEDRVLSAGLDASDDRPLSLSAIRPVIISSGIIARASTKDNWIPGAYYAGRNGRMDNEATLHRLMDGLEWYFSRIREANEDRWEAKDGRVCNNFGVPGHIRLLGELIRHIERRDRVMMSEMTLQDIQSHLDSMLKPVLSLISSASPEQFDQLFNVKLGSGGVKQYYFALSQCVHQADPSFLPAGFEQWLSEIGVEEQEKADKDARWIQGQVHSIVVDKLRKVYGEKFFDRGISNKEIQVAAHKKRLDDDEEDRGGPEKYLDFLDLKKIVEQKENWQHFEGIFNIPLPG